MIKFEPVKKGNGHYEVRDKVAGARLCVVKDDGAGVALSFDYADAVIASKLINDKFEQVLGDLDRS